MKDFDLAKSTHAVSAPLLKYCFTVTCNKILILFKCVYLYLHEFYFVSGKCYQNMAKAYIQLEGFTKANASKAVGATQ